MAGKYKTNAMRMATPPSSRSRVATTSKDAGPHKLTSAATADGEAEAETDEADESEDADAKNADEPDVLAPSAVSDLPVDTPTKQPRDLLAGLRLRSEQKNSMPPPSTTPAHIKQSPSVDDAVFKRMSELKAQGWRPEEETQSIADDDDYGDVDLVSDSDEDDSTMRKREEKSIFGNRSREEENALARRLSLCSGATDDLDATEFADLEFDPNQETSIGHWLDMHFDSRRTSFDGDVPSILAEDSAPSNAGQSRRVRFQDEVDMSDAGSSDSEQIADTFPDLFGEAPPGLNTSMHQLTDSLNVDDASDAGSCWDFEGDEHIDADDNDDTSSSAVASDANDTDDGETTDEEMPPPPPPSTAGRPSTERPSTSGSASSASQELAQRGLRLSSDANFQGRRRSGSSATKLPTVGTFMLDPRRPVLLVDGSGSNQRNIFFPAKIQSAADDRFWNRLQKIYNGRSSSPHTFVHMSQDYGVRQIHDTIDDIAFFNALGSLRSEEVVGPPHAFMPFTNIDAGGNVSEDVSMQSVSDADEQEFLRLVNFDSESESGEVAEDSDAMDVAWKTPLSFPSLLSTNTSRRDSEGDDLLAHLDRNRGLVGSFRRNQHLAKQIGSLASHPTLRASTSETNAMQSGRRAAANTPITPLRKKRMGKDVGMRSSPMASPTFKIPNKKKGPVRGGFGGRR